jgi:hypothetical protein
MLVAFAMAQVQYMSADVRTSQSAIATATETSLMRSANAVETVKPTSMPMAFVTTWMTVLESLTPVACAMVLVRSSRADVQAFPKAIVTATATSLMPWAFAVETVSKMQMPMAFVTTSTPVWVNPMNVGCAMVLDRFTIVDVRSFQKGIAIAMATSWMPLGSVVVTAPPTPMRMAFATTSTTVWVNWMRVTSAMALEPFMSADVRTSPRVIATAAETSLMRSVNAVETAKRTPMPMAFVMTWMTVLESSTLAACAMVLVRSSRVDVQAFPKATATAMATNSMPWAFVAAVAQKTLMRMASVTT